MRPRKSQPVVVLSGRVRRALGVAAVVMLAACGGSDPVYSIGNGKVRGAVNDDAGASVSNAVVALTGNGQAARSTASGADGVYTFADVPPGSYALAVTPPPGYTIPPTGTVAVSVGAQTVAPPFVVNRMPPDSVFAAELRAHLEAATAAGAFSGAVLVTRGGQTLFEGAYGLADRERGVPNTPLTQFRMGSMDKMLTAVAVLQLVQAGKARLDVPLSTYLPDYPNAELASRVTLHHLLTHTGGTGNIFGSLYNANRLELRTTADWIRLFGTRALLFEPGTRHDYSNYGYILLGAVIEQLSGMSYYDYVAAHILAPAGMTLTGSAPEDSLVPGRSVGYTWQLVQGSLVSNAPMLPYRGTAAGGGYSTVGDIARFANALREHRLLDAAHTDLLIEGKVPLGPAGIVKYAYGFIDRVQVGRRLVGHGGGFPGMNGELSFEPRGGYTSVVLSNFDPQAATMIEAFLLGRLPAN
jgi:D-alanyl-D-alanine carboxypeptidase